MKRLCAQLLFLFFSAAPALPALPYSEISDGSELLPMDPFEIGVNMHLDGLPNVARVHDMGATWVRIDLNWESIEPVRGHFNFAAPDLSVRDAKSQGLKVFATLAYAPAWARKVPGSDNTAVPDAAEWREFVRQTARHYCGEIEAYGIWNEPNLEEFWAGSAEDYVELLLKPAYPVIKAESPEAIVAGPELAHLYSARLGIQGFFDAISRLQAQDSFDVLSHHLYGGDDFASKITGFTFLGLRYKPGLKQMLERSHLADKPVWITECGADAKDKSELAQAQLIARQMALLSAQPWIKKAFLYQLGDDAGNGPQWGVMRQDRSLKPAFYELQNLIYIIRTSSGTALN